MAHPHVSRPTCSLFPYGNRRYCGHKLNISFYSACHKLAFELLYIGSGHYLPHMYAMYCEPDNHEYKITCPSHVLVARPAAMRAKKLIFMFLMFLKDNARGV